MPKKIDKEKEQAFIEAFCEGDTANNAVQSAIKAGYSKDMKGIRSMGSYLKKKYSKEIREKNEERITSTSGLAISVLQDLLKSEQDAVRLNTAKLILELGNFSSQTINLNVDNTHSKTDDELIKELQGLMKTIPNFEPKLQNLIEVEEENNQTNPNEEEDSKNIVKH